jgi:hypothetical protein
MAEPHQRAGRPRKRSRTARAALLVGAMIVLALSGLFVSRSASAAPTTQTSVAASAAQAAPVSTTADFEPGAGICNVPGIGDIGGILDLCNAGTSGFIGAANNVCTTGAPSPELATGGIDSLITTPGSQTTGLTLYDNYGMAGLSWSSYGLTCSQLTSSIGNNVANMVFDIAKSLDRVTITVYQSASSNSLLTWLSSSVNRLITALGNAVYFPFLAPMVIIAVIWLAWQGLIRKRATRTFEGTIWMVVAAAAAIWLIGQPNDFTSVGTTVSNGVTSVLNDAFSNLPATTGSNCLPVTTTDPQSVTANYSFDSGNGLVDDNANELWSVLVCKPWLDGELGTTQYAVPNSPGAASNIVNQYGRQLLWAQAVAVNEKPVTTDLVSAKQDTFTGIAAALKSDNPAVYSLFTGDQWTTRLEIGFEALFAAIAAGLLILLISLTLIILKLGWLLLLVAGPFFLIIGIHPGFGRVIAIRWFEMLVGVLLKQVAVALTLSVLLYCYSLIMSTTDQVLPWALKIMMIALVTVAVFIYRKPFQHLFSSVGYGMLGNDQRAQVSLRESTFGFRRVTSQAAGVVAPNVGAARASRWARRAGDVGGASGAAADAASGGAAASGATVSDGTTTGGAAESQTSTRQWPGAGVGSGGGRAAPPLPLPLPSHSGPAGNGAPGGSAGSGSLGSRAPQRGGPSTGAPSAGWARGAAAGPGGQAPTAPPARGPAPSPARPGPAPAHPASGAAEPAARRAPPERFSRCQHAAQRDAAEPAGVASGQCEPLARRSHTAAFGRLFHRNGRAAAEDPAGRAVLGALAPPVQVTAAGHGPDPRTAAAAVRPHRGGARRPGRVPDRQPPLRWHGRRAGLDGHPQPVAQRQHAVRRPAVRRPVGHAGLDRGRGRDLPVAAVQRDRPGRRGADHRRLRQGLRDLELQDVQGRLRGPVQGPGHRAGAVQPGVRLLHRGRRPGPDRGQAGVDRHRLDHPDQHVRGRPGVDHVRRRHRPAGDH